MGKFVEFFGPGVSHLSIADRATIANMCPEYGATIGFFPVDEKSLMYLRQTGNLLLLAFTLKLFELFGLQIHVDNAPLSFVFLHTCIPLSLWMRSCS